MRRSPPAGCHVAQASLVRELAPARDLRALGSLVALLRRLRPHVVHARSAKARFLAPLAARLARVPVTIQTVHGWSFNNAVDRRRAVFIRLERLARRFCDATVLVSRQDLAEGLALGVLPTHAVARGEAPAHPLRGSTSGRWRRLITTSPRSFTGWAVAYSPAGARLM